jgi:adenylate/nucleoside-diphosphate kinase
LNSIPTSEEEEAGKDVKERMQEVDFHYDWDAALEQSQKVLGVLKEHVGEEFTKEISGSGKIESVTIRIQMEIDPFFTRADNPEDVRTTADLGEEEKLPRGDFGDYCPVTFVKEGFLIKGVPEFEATFFGKSFVFASEKELEEFKTNPATFLVGHAGPSSLPLEPPPPKIMILGTNGSGVTTQINKLCDKYKLESFHLKDSLQAKMKADKE